MLSYDYPPAGAAASPTLPAVLTLMLPPDPSLLELLGATAAAAVGRLLLLAEVAFHILFCVTEGKTICRLFFPSVITDSINVI